MPVTDARLFSVQVGSAEPIYRQIVEQAKRLIAGGQLLVDDHLPSVRDMAATHAINPMTISKAYGQLEADGAILRKRGVGMVVAPPAEGTRRQATRIELIKPSLERVARESEQLELPAEAVIAALKRILKGRR